MKRIAFGPIDIRIINGSPRFYVRLWNRVMMYWPKEPRGKRFEFTTAAIALPLVILCLALTGCQANGVPTTQTTQAIQGVATVSQIALDDASVTVAVLSAAGKLTPAEAAKINAAIGYAQTLLQSLYQHAGDPASVQIQAEFQTAVSNVNLLITNSQAKLQATTRPAV